MFCQFSYHTLGHEKKKLSYTNIHIINLLYLVVVGDMALVDDNRKRNNGGGKLNQVLQIAQILDIQTSLRNQRTFTCESEDEDSIELKLLNTYNAETNHNKSDLKKSITIAANTPVEERQRRKTKDR